MLDVVIMSATQNDVVVISAHERYLGVQDTPFEDNKPHVMAGSGQTRRASGHTIELVSHSKDWKTAVTKLRIVEGVPSHIILNVGCQYMEEYWSADYSDPPTYPFLLISENSILPLPKYHYVCLVCDADTTVEYEEVVLDIPDTSEYRMTTEPVSDYKYEWKVCRHYLDVPLDKSSPSRICINHPVEWVQVIGPVGWKHLRLRLDDVYLLDFERQRQRPAAGVSVWTLRLSPTINFSRVGFANLEYDGPPTTNWRLLVRSTNRLVYMNGMIGLRYGS
jgi:hypothetical protein